MEKGSRTEPGLKILKRRGSKFAVLNGRGWVPDWVLKGVGREGSLRKGAGSEGFRGGEGADAEGADERVREGRGGPTEEGPSRPARGRRGSWEERLPGLRRTELISKLSLGAGRRRVPKGRSYVAEFVMGGASGEVITEGRDRKSVV